MSEQRPTAQALIVRAVATLLVGVVLAWTLYTVRSALLVVYISGLLALGFSPTIRWLQRQPLLGRTHTPRWLAILVVYFGLLAVVIGAIAIIIPPLVRQAAQLRHDLPANLARLETFLMQRGLLDHELTLQDALDRFPAAAGALPVILIAVQNIIGTLGTIVAILVLPYYLLIDADQIQSGFLRLFPEASRPMLARITRDVTFKVGAWLNGQFFLCLFIGGTASIGLWLLGVPYFYVLGLIAAIGEFVPIIGPIMSMIPAALVALTVSPWLALWVIVFFSVQQFLEGNVLVPRIMSRQVGVSAWSVIIALLIGSELLGIVGAILAVPSAAIVQVFLDEYAGRHEVDA